MHFFFDGRARPEINGTYVRRSPTYLEIQKHSSDPAGISYTYVIPFSEHDFLVVACLESLFDPWLKLLTDRRLGREYLRYMQSELPISGRHLNNGFSGRYSDGALLNVQDPDTGNSVWILATLVGNLDTSSFDDIDQLLIAPRLMEAYSIVWFGARSMFREVGSGTKPSLRPSVRLFLGSVQRDTIDFSRVVFDNLPKLIEVAKALV